MANSKNLGNEYEREFSKKLSAWITENPDADICWRDLGSGSRHTTRGKQGKETAYQGDIICTDLNYQWFFNLFYIDTKSYKEFNPIISNPKNLKSNEIFNQWKKTIQDCPENKIPIMPCKIRDRRTPEFIIMPSYVVLKSDNLIKYYIKQDNYTYLFKLIIQEEFFNLNNAKEFHTGNSHFMQEGHTSFILFNQN